MSIAKLGRILIAIAIFLFAVGGAIYFGKHYSQRGQVDKENVFCLACLEGQFYKTQTWNWQPKEPNYDQWHELIYIPSDLAISERALLIKILTHFSNIASQARFNSEPVALWMDQFYRAWGKARPHLKIRIPYFARIENHKPSWPSEPEQGFFGGVVSGEFNKDPLGVILISPTQTEFDATLSIAHALFRLFDPAHKELTDLPIKLKEVWLEFRAFLCEIEIWHILNRYFESPALSYYHFEKYPQFWQQAQNENYFEIFLWMVERQRQNLINASYYQVLPPLKNKMSIEPVAMTPSTLNGVIDILNLAISPFANLTWSKFLSKDSSFDGLLVATSLKDAEKTEPKNYILQMRDFIFKTDPHFNSEDPKFIFKRFYELLDKNGVRRPEKLNEDMNLNIRGEF